jgi:nucleoside-diphosphate-sugar epimerase
VCGFALGSPMNMLSAIGVFAALQRERGEPLRFPGGAPCITQATDADLLARAIVWAAEEPACAKQTFNITNGDVMVWQEIFRVVAEVFGMPLAEPLPQRLAEAMPSQEPLWQQIVQRHGLAPHSMERLIGASWQFADAVFGAGGSPADTVVSTVKARRFGFFECVDTEEMFVRQLTELQALRILPR